MKRPNLPDYETPDDFVCPECEEYCHIIPLDNSFDYSGTHCTHGLSGTEYPPDYGIPVTDCCEVQVEIEPLVMEVF